MATVKRFEDLEVWKDARELCQMVFKLISKPEFSKDRALKSQANRSSGSIMDNIAEGFDRGENKEFIHFLSISRASCGELRSQLYRAFDRNYITKSEFETAVEKSKGISGRLTNFIKYLKQTDNKGLKFQK